LYPISLKYRLNFEDDPMIISIDLEISLHDLIILEILDKYYIIVSYDKLISIFNPSLLTTLV